MPRQPAEIVTAPRPFDAAFAHMIGLMHHYVTLSSLAENSRIKKALSIYLDPRIERMLSAIERAHAFPEKQFESQVAAYAATWASQTMEEFGMRTRGQPYDLQKQELMRDLHKDLEEAGRMHGHPLRLAQAARYMRMLPFASFVCREACKESAITLAAIAGGVSRPTMKQRFAVLAGGGRPLASFEQQLTHAEIGLNAGKRQSSDGRTYRITI